MAVITSRPQAKPVDVTVEGGDIGILARSFRRSLVPTEYSPSTVRIYTISVAQLADFLAQRNMPLVVANITAEHINEFLADVLQRRSAGTAVTRYRGVRAFFRWAFVEGEITQNPMARIKRPKEPESPPTMLKEEELSRLIKTCEGTDFEARRDTAIIRLFIDTGMRRSEMAYIPLGDLDLDNHQVRVTGKASRNTAARTRVVHFGRKAALAIDRYLRIRSKHEHARTTALWLGRQGPLQDGAIDLMIRRRARQAGLPPTHSHIFRHGFAHDWLSGGGQERDLMMLTGWRSSAMLARYAASAAAERAQVAYSNRPSPSDRL